MWIHRGVIALSLIASVSGACAARHGGSFAARFVRGGKPAIDLGGPAPAPERAKAGSKKPEPVAAPHAASFGTSVENTDVRLSAALVVEKTVPTPENYLRVAREYKRLGILDASADHLKLALTIAPRYAEAHEELARVWRDWGFPDLGLGAAYRAVYFAPQSASARNTLGTLLSALGHYDAARAAYLRAVALDDKASWALSNLCDLERRAGRGEDARAHCEAALQLDPAFAAAHNNLALVLASQDDIAGAREQFLAAGDEASAEYNVGIVQLSRGEYEAAAASFERAIRLRPDFTAAKERAHAARLRLLTGGN